MRRLSITGSFQSWTSGVAIVFAVVIGFGSSGCDPYGTFNDPDETLGPVDPVLFPPANMGTGGDRKRPGRGRFSEITAYVGDMPVGYFSYAMPDLGMGVDPLRVLEDGKAYASVPAPLAYVFDGTGDSPFPPEDRYPCRPPPGYQYQQRRDMVDFSQQGAVFTKLPEATYTEGALPTYKYVLPVVSEAGMLSTGMDCQRLKSAKRIQEVMGMVPPPTGRYLAWLIIDPAAPVYPRETPTGVLEGGRMHAGVGLQRWGWYNRYLVAYLDGGYIPTEEVMVPGPSIDMPTMIKATRMKFQRLFVPRQIKSGMGMAAGKAGAGYDVLEFKRGDPGYSPVCQVWNYGDPMATPVAPGDLPRNAAAIVNNAALNAAPASPATHVFCLQVR